MLPNLIVPGSQKCGTTSLCDFLAMHPDCLVARPKEPAFFSRVLNMQKLHSYEHYFRHGATRRPSIIIDGTTEYMTNVDVPNRLKEHLGGKLRFLFVIRRPEKRAYAAYTHLAKRGHERRSVDTVFGSLPDDTVAAISEEKSRLVTAIEDRTVALDRYRRLYDNFEWPFLYIANSLYSTAIERYQNAFGKNAVRVLVFEELVRSPLTVRASIAEFLELDESLFPEVFPHSNSTQVPSINKLGFALRSLAGSFAPSLVPKFAPVTDGFVRVRAPEAFYDSLKPLFASEREYWSNYFGRDVRDFGW